MLPIPIVSGATHHAACKGQCTGLDILIEEVAVNDLAQLHAHTGKSQGSNVVVGKGLAQIFCCTLR